MPGWKLTISLADVFHDDSKTFDQRRDHITHTIRHSKWPALSAMPELLDRCLTDLAAAPDPATFDRIWNRIYDVADADRVWIETLRAQSPRMFR